MIYSRQLSKVRIQHGFHQTVCKQTFFRFVSLSTDMKLYFVFSHELHIIRSSWLCNFYWKYGRHDSDEEPVFSVTMLAIPGAMRWTAAMKEQLISQYLKPSFLASKDLGLKNQVELRTDIPHRYR